MLDIAGLRKTFLAHGSRVTAVDNVDLTVRAGELLTMLGPSGCGKTTTLRCIAGLEKPDAGRITIGGRVVVDIERNIFIPAADRNIGMVFQSYAIWPHMSVFENVAFPLRVARDRKYRESDIRDAVGRALAMVRLDALGARRATQLSGGQQQRLAFARGIVRTPSLLLLDEPLSNLDARLRDDMRAELKRLQTTLGLTTIYVTHDQAEALALSDEVALFHAGRIEQRATPDEIYRRPASRFVADFIGAANFLPGTVETSSDDLLSVHTQHGAISCIRQQALQPGAPVTISLRPETIQLHATAPATAANALPCTVTGRTFLGDILEYAVDLGHQELRVRAPANRDFAAGDKLFAVFDTADCLALTA
jgi:iron(III) transport system ATP-binding protein